MIVAIHQPAYLPWLGYFDRIARADAFVFLDTVQFQKQSFQNRNKIRTADGWIWLTVPVETKGRLYDTALKDLPINNRIDWRRKHRAAIETNYRKAPCFDAVMPKLLPFYEQEWERLADLCLAMLHSFNDWLGITTPVLRASEIEGLEGAKGDLVLSICERLGADAYLSGSLGRGYLDEAAFRQAGIALGYQDYQHPTYDQAYPGFEPGMAVIDLMMNEPDPAAFLRRGLETEKRASA